MLKYNKLNRLNYAYIIKISERLEKMKKTLLLLLILCTAFLSVPQNALADDLSDLDLLGNDIASVNVGGEAQAASGSCGDNVFWSYDSDSKTLTISGQGAMKDDPWHEHDIYSVVIEDGITNICRDAFRGFDNLTDVEIPKSVIRIELGCFDFSTNLTNISVDVDNKYYSSYDGMLFDKELTTLICCPAGKTTCNFPVTLTHIGGFAFTYCNKFTSIKIPETVTTMPNSIYTFFGCDSLVEITHSGVEIIGNEGLHSTPVRTVKISEGTKILVGTFEQCENLETVYLPASLEQIGYGTFEDCFNLKKIYYAGTKEQWGKIDIAPDNREMDLAKLEFTGEYDNNTPGDNDKPDDKPVTPEVPEKLPVVSQPGGLGSKITVQVTGEHWLTVQVRRAGSIALTSIQAQGQGLVEAGFSAAAGSIVQIWETEEAMSFTDGVPDNKILATVVENI